MFQSFNALFIIIFAPVFAWIWVYLSNKGLEPSTPAKFGLAIIQVGLGFAVLVLGIQFADEGGQVAAFWLILMYLLHTTGELCLSPVGLSMVTKLSVTRVACNDDGRLVSFECICVICRRHDRWCDGDRKYEDWRYRRPLTSIVVYSQVFEKLAIVAVVMGAVLLAFAPWLSHKMKISNG